MKRNFCYLFAIMLFLNACNNTPQVKEEKPKDTVIELKETGRNHSPDSISSQSDIMDLFPGEDTLGFALKMDAGQHVTIPLDIHSGDSVYAKLMSDDSMANIRFTQIALPDQTFDGPFGRELIYGIRDTGRYALIIGQNRMAGDPWQGSFTLKVWVK